MQLNCLKKYKVLLLAVTTLTTVTVQNTKPAKFLSFGTFGYHCAGRQR